MQLACTDGKRLLEARDRAIAVTKSFELGMRLNAIVTSEYKVIRAEYEEACVQVKRPALSYNKHLTVCETCKVTPPTGRYSND